MGEKRRRALLQQESRRILDDADPMEAAWRNFARTLIPADAPPSQRSEMRKAFYGGAAMMFEAIVNGTDEDHEPTAEDMARVTRIAEGLVRFAAELDASLPAQGSA